MTIRNFLLTVFLLVAGFTNAQLTGITPNTATLGQTISTTITSNGIFIESSSPSGNLYSIRLKKTGSTPIDVFFVDWFPYMFTATVDDPDTVTAEITIPFTATVGNYDVEVITGDVLYPQSNQTTWLLPSGFAVLPPDGYVTGNVYDDLNRNGVKDGGEPGVQGIQVKLLPLNYLLTTDANGDYSFPAMNGSYSVVYIPDFNDYKFVSTVNDTIPVTINNGNAPGNDFGIVNAITSITPNTGYRGVSTLHQIVADEPIFSAGNISNVVLFTTPTAISINGTSVTIIDPYTIQVNINIPISTNNATGLDVRVYTFGPFDGYHFLRDQFTVQDPVSFISGRMFFDLNQNKINEPTEPGIDLAGVQLMPDGSIAYANGNGDFILGSTGGIQVLSPLNNIPGLSLFTDSATYTLNTATNITGQDFGYISTEPDYSIMVHGLYLFPRCFTSQPVTFKVRNTSNITYDASVWLKYESTMTYQSSNITPVSTANDTVHWNVTIQPYSEVLFSTQFLLPGPGSALDLSAGATSLNGSGVGQLSDQEDHTFAIICAMDPNDKQVTPEGILTEHFVLMNDALEYLIRFQNTGNDTAFNVVVLDTLDANLDFSTFEILGSSHSMTTELNANGSMRFIFNNILLPDSNVNEAGSHGYIKYRIHADGNLPDSTEVINTAYIYFDFNPAVVTNTTLNTFVFVLPSGLNDPDESMHVRLYPNPFSNSATLSFENPNSEKFSLILTDVTGKAVSKGIVTDGNTFVIEKNNLGKGLYFYQLLNIETQRMQIGKMIIQ